MSSDNLIPTKEGYKGAVRIHEKSIDELAKDAARIKKEVSNTDKAADIH